MHEVHIKFQEFLHLCIISGTNTKMQKCNVLDVQLVPIIHVIVHACYISCHGPVMSGAYCKNVIIIFIEYIY